MKTFQAKPLLNNKNVAELVDPTLDGDYDSEQLDRVATVASLCIDPDPAERPKMSQVHFYLYTHWSNPESNYNTMRAMNSPKDCKHTTRCRL